MQVSSKKVLVAGVKANVTVLVCQGDDIQVSVPGGSIDQFNVEWRDDQVLVTGKGRETTTHSTSTPKGQFTVNITGSTIGGMAVGPGAKVVGSVVVNGNSSDTPMSEIEIKVPKGTAITLDKVDGTVTIGDVEGKITATFDDHVHTIGKMNGGLVKALGDAYVTIRNMSGDVTLAVDRDGEIVVEGGHADTLAVEAKWDGQVSCRATCTWAKVTADDDSMVRLRGEVRNKPLITTHRNGCVKVNWKQ